MAGVHSHRSPWAGTWYPDDAAELKDLISEACRASVKRNGPFVRPGAVAFLVPHAAPAYSGVVAASAYRHAQATNATRAIILGFSHRRLVHGIAVSDASSIATPLGGARVDRDFADALAASPPFHSAPAEVVCDHSAEIQIPFLQTFLPEAAIVPVYVGHLSDQQRRDAARALRSAMDSRTVLIASSDLTHYGRDFGYQPFDTDSETPARLRELDMGALTAAGSLDPALFQSQISRTGATVCGTEPIKLLLETLNGVEPEIFQETLDYQTSGDIVCDYRHSVSYGVAAYFPASAWHLDLPRQTELLAAARFALDHFRRTRGRCFRSACGLSLQQRGRAFVTLLERDAVRGCVGCFHIPQPLVQSVQQLAVDAAGDTRFGRIDDWDCLEIEVHVLTPPKRIARPDQFQAGLHGALLKAGACQGLLLPVVAERHGLDRDEFLRVLARKAGLRDSVYSGSDWELSIFRDQVFRENNEMLA
ncbi:MAG TPA: AmmeMemoRadiSam system protein B [Verrucomicrobiae bacterium]|nr:AmmeMemoRadiSam system protein B [Verrucomicrobiae bacterium]